MECETALWSAVVTQAVEDIQDFPVDSTEYTQAVCFFLNAGPWGERRAEIAECLDLHSDDLKRIGLRVINRRRLVEGLAPLTGRESRHPPAKGTKPPAPPPAPEPEVRPEVLHTPGKRGVEAGPVPGVLTWRRRTVEPRVRPPAQNPFHPGYQRVASS
jgi:hypothetical protein